jgi:thiamine biosynthesis lipoprotein
MGVEARIVVFAPAESLGRDAARTAFARIRELDSILSDYRRDSELSRVSATAHAAAAPVGGDLFVVLRTADALARETGGALDVTAGALVRLWRDARRTGRLPSRDAVCEAHSRGGWRHMTLDTVHRTVRFAVPGVQLDVGAIGKGYAADAALASLRARGFGRALVSIGGDLVVGRAPPGRHGWTVAIDTDSGPRVLEIEHGAVSTSGDGEQGVVLDGVRYSHVVDPRTGYALASGVSATVRAPSGIEADAWATAASVLDSRARDAFIAARPQADFFVREGDGAARADLTGRGNPCGRAGGQP